MKITFLEFFIIFNLIPDFSDPDYEQVMNSEEDSTNLSESSFERDHESLVDDDAVINNLFGKNKDVNSHEDVLPHKVIERIERKPETVMSFISKMGIVHKIAIGLSFLLLFSFVIILILAGNILLLILKYFNFLIFNFFYS